ncbi:sugar phosphate isomerase/epimerase family protein [Butyrivibrio sp. YAB3001]|uniref:sugar phosphate isomerase/epimerase family protein n=1 Tax=Butyrivibrio sp. YAB3001 TaxID=1520812 RepID=UPI0008F68837|nr:sugar phosphate isomerase/epimerase [Butyrivibrio sp. YAB3001]SFC59603.1 Sugar phosphate isomerase/epimerase [Butyrivibrio sp. YAB3001]
MRMVFSPKGLITDIRYPGQGLIDIQNAGFTEVVLDGRLAIAEEEFRYVDRYRKFAKQENRAFLFDEPSGYKGRLEAFLSEVRKRNLKTKIAYAPCIKTEVRNPICNDPYRKLVQESVRLAVEQECESIIVKPVFIGVSLEKEWEVNKEFYLSLLPIVKGTNTRILLQNQYQNHEGHMVRGMMSDSLEAIKWVDELNQAAGENRYGFCLDIGACNLCGIDVYEFITSLGKKIDAVIFSDNDGHQEEALLPFSSISDGLSTTDWLSVIRGLREISYDGVAIIDIGTTIRAVSVMLRPAYMELARETMKFLEWQITIEKQLQKYKNIVLFGAGYMCMNYMESYGDKYHPLFTCDNNSSRWGEEFCGLTIHSPKDLLTIPDSTCIIICNTFFREIKEQIKQMGIEADIVYFDGEYSPKMQMKYRRF